jgi:hypothetical protein
MQSEPVTSTDGHIKDGSGRPVTPAANSSGGEALSRPALDNPNNAGSIMPAPLTSGEAAVATPAYVYAIGQIDPRFPTLSVEKEFAQATGRAETVGLSDRRALHAVLSRRENRYLARQLCWVLTIENLDTYILHPRDPADIDLLVAAVRPTPRPTDTDVVIGVRGPIAPPEMCNGLMIPIVVFDQIYSFDVDTLVKSIPRPKDIPAKDFAEVAEELFYRIMQLADNAGATDEHRAVVFLAVRSERTYGVLAEAFARNNSLSAVDVRLSPLSGTRRIMEVIFSFTNRQTDVTEKFFTRVDVTEKFPFMATPWSPYFDR